MKNNIEQLGGQDVYEAVLNTVSENVIVIDKHLNIIFQNKINHHIYGDQIGKSCYVAYRQRRDPCEDCLVLEVLKDGKERRGIKDARLPNGDVIWVELSSSALRDNEGNIVGAVEAIRNVTEKMRLGEECNILRREMERRAQFENIVTQSKAMKAVFRLIERIASTNSTVMITGESGTGKELIAKAILFNSDRKDKPFVALNCGAIPENLLESELFGHVRGAFTGAVRDHGGLIETAHTGTLFLDEVSEIPLSLQVKLLRFLQEGECRRVGDTTVRKFDVRIISATNRDLEEAVREGQFREDLYFRLSVIPIFLPPLRDRREDIPLLATHLFQNLSDVHKRNVAGISSAALKKLLDYPWTGNVRELENAIEYALHLTDDGETISVEQLPPKIQGPFGALHHPPQFVSLETYTKHAILSLQEDHSEAQIAEILGFSRKNLWEKRKRWGIVKPAKSNKSAACLS